MPPRQRSPKKARRSRNSNPYFLPFREGFGTSSTVVVGFGASSTPITSSPQTLVASLSSISSTPNAVGSYISPTEFATSAASLSLISSTSNTVGSSVSPTQANTSATWKRKWNAPIWKEYDIYDGHIFEDGKPRAICKYCKAGPMDATSDNGTSNFIRHNETCEARLSSVAFKDDSLAYNLDMSLYKEMIALCIIRHAYPFTFAEHEGNRNLHKLLNLDFKPICRNTAKNHVVKIHEREKERLRDFMHRVSGRICLTSDMWTSSVCQGYLSLTAHFIDDDWNLHAKILNFCQVGPPHTTVVLHDRLLDLLKSWGIENKLLSITLDNARCNDNMQSMLSRSLSTNNSLMSNGDYFRIRYSAHILNLVVQDGLLVINEGVHKIRMLVKYVTGLEHRILKFQETALFVGIDCSKKVCLDCCTRWNSTYKMLDRALVYHVAFLRSMERADSNFPTIPTLEEWLRIEKICALLKPFDILTTLISGKNYPTANLYLHNIWRIEFLLLQYASCDDIFLKEMALRMKVKFDKYWESYSLILSFTAMLDPRYKFQLIQRCFKELDLQTFTTKSEHVKTQFRKLFDEYVMYAGAQVGGNMYEVEDHNGDDVEGLQYFDELSEDKSELDAYLEAPRSKCNGRFSVLVWWKDNANKYPIVAQMARDILVIPITTVASESAFSMGSRIITKWRSSLDPETADALLTSRSWLFGFDIGEGYNENQEIEGLEFQISTSLNNNQRD